MGWEWWPGHISTTLGWFWVHARNTAHLRPQSKWVKIRKLKNMWPVVSVPYPDQWFYSHPLKSGLSSISWPVVLEPSPDQWSQSHILTSGFSPIPWPTIRTFVIGKSVTSPWVLNPSNCRTRWSIKISNLPE